VGRPEFRPEGASPQGCEIGVEFADSRPVGRATSMKSQCRFVAVLGALALLSAATQARAQNQAHIVDPSGFIAALSSGSIQGVVRDEQGTPVGGALVSALGATTGFTKTDRSGRFELASLTPGPYLVRAHLSGFVASHGQMVEVTASRRTTSRLYRGRG